MKSQSRPWLKRPPVMFSILIALFGIPMLLASLLVSHRVFWGTVHHGQLLSPPVPFPTQAIIKPVHTTPERFTGHWWLLYQRDPNAKQACNENCIKQLHTLKQLHIALNKNQKLLARGLLLSTHQRLLPQTAMALRSAATGTAIFEVHSQAITQRLTGKMSKKLAFSGDLIYLMDPQARIVLLYPATVPGEAVLKDLNRLLKVAHHAR